MKNIKTTKINKKAFKRLPDLIDTLVENKGKTEVSIKISFCSYYSQMIALKNIIDAINVISYQNMNTENENNNHLVNGLSNIASKMIPFSESEFLDELLIENSYSDQTFTEINKI